MDEILTLMKEQNEQNHADIKKDIGEVKNDIKWIRNRIAPQVAANKKAIGIILFLIAALGFLKAFAAF